MKSSSKKTTLTVRIFNTVQPVAPLYRDLIPHWIAKGWRVEVVMSRAEYRAGREKEWLKQGVNVRWTPGFGLNAHKKPGKVIIMLAYIVFAAIKSLFGPGVERNLFLTQPPLFFAWGGILKKLRKQPYFIALMDVYPDTAVQAKLLKKDSLLGKLLSRISRFGFQWASGVIAIGRCMEQRLIGSGVPAEKIRVIPNWTTPGEIVPIANSDNSLRKQNNWQDKFIVLYSGNIGISHFFDDILTVSLRLRFNPDILFVFFGAGPRVNEIVAFKNEHDLDNIRLFSLLEQHLLSLSLSAGDIHFVSLRAGFEGLVVPSKTYGALAVGRPVIYQGAPQGEIARFIEEEDIGCVVGPHRPDQLEEAILRYVNDPLLAWDQGVKARRLAETRYDGRAACEQYTRFVLLKSAAKNE